MTAQPKFLRKPEVLRRVPFSGPTLQRKVKEGTFPAPVRIGARAVAWLIADIEAWENAVITERDTRLSASKSEAA